jgi:hypothetical protein
MCACAIRAFLDANRGEVVILFLEPYVPLEEIARTMRESGLIRYVRALHRDEPLPTLGQLVRENRRVIVITENDADGSIPWYMDGFSLVQDTPLGAQKVSQLSCTGPRMRAQARASGWADRSRPLRPGRADRGGGGPQRGAHAAATGAPAGWWGRRRLTSRSSAGPASGDG